MTYKERKHYEDLSLQAFGTKHAYKKLIDKGEWINFLGKTKAGEKISMRRRERLELEDVVKLMEEIIEEKQKAFEEAKAKALEKQSNEKGSIISARFYNRK